MSNAQSKLVAAPVPMLGRRYIFKISCPDRIGIVAAISTFIASEGGWITEASHHSDIESSTFTARYEVRADTIECDISGLEGRFASLATAFAMRWAIHDSSCRPRIVIAASKATHCLEDLLSRWRSGELPMDIVAVVSNHLEPSTLAEGYGLPFYAIEVNADDRKAASKSFGEICDSVGVDLIVLARYMQILDADICERYEGKIINIHHSFLPSFAGARPYHQAFQRGVKLIGATCHYVTSELDTGPIIEQDVARINHADNPADLERYGRDLERVVLAAGVRFHIEQRVVMLSNKTIVFR